MRRTRRLPLLAGIISAMSAGAAFAHGEVERFADVAATLFGHPVHPMPVVTAGFYGGHLVYNERVAVAQPEAHRH